MAKRINLNCLKHLKIDQAVIDADAATILHSATQAVSKILARRAEMDKAGLQDKPLIVLAGEDHTISATNLHHILMLKQLRQSEPGTVFAYEYPHDFGNNVSRLLNADPSKLNTEDKSRWLLSMYMDVFTTAFSRYGKKTLYNFCLQQNINFKPTDVSILGDLRIKSSDPSTRDSLEACSKNKSWLSRIFTSNSRITATSRRGMFVRNHHMSKTAIAFAEETNARILVQHCGNFHVSGSKIFPKDESLRSLYRKAGHEAVTVYADKDADHDTSTLPGWKARYDYMAVYRPKTTDFTSERQERTYVDALLVKSKMSKYRFTAKRKKEAGHTLVALAKASTSPQPPL